MKTSTERRKANEKANKKQRGGWRKLKGIWPKKDPAFIAWLHRLPCVACWFEKYSDRSGALAVYIEFAAAGMWSDRTFDVEAAHIGDRGQGQKCSDREACPLCSRHHDRGSAIGHHVLGKTFWTRYGIPKLELIEALNTLYDSLQ